MGRKQFLVLYQKKKFKKNTVLLTLLSQFFVELPIIICDVVALSALPMGEQVILTIMDTLALSVFLIVLEFVEIARLDKIMKTLNTSGHKSKKAAAACESSEDENDPLLSTDSSSEEDDYPDWRLMLKHVEGNNHLFKQTKFQLHLNYLEKEVGKRGAFSCIDFATGTEKELDDREVKSFPPSPKMYADFKGIDVHNFGL